MWLMYYKVLYFKVLWVLYVHSKCKKWLFSTMLDAFWLWKLSVIIMKLLERIWCILNYFYLNWLHMFNQFTNFLFFFLLRSPKLNCHTLFWKLLQCINLWCIRLRSTRSLTIFIYQISSGGDKENFDRA